jgi:hypothetical protein
MVLKVACEETRELAGHTPTHHTSTYNQVVEHFNRWQMPNERTISMAQDASEGLWQSLLREASIIMCDSGSAVCSQKLIVYTFWVCCAQAMRKKRVPDSTLIVVGANKCGKRTLLSHLQTSSAPDNSNCASQTDSSK